MSPHPHETNPRLDDRAHAAEAPTSLALGHSAAEWATLMIGLFVILGLAGLVLILSITGGSEPPRFAAMPLLDQVRQDEHAYSLPIAVTNLGGLTAQDVRVVAELTAPGGAPTTAEFTIDILAGGESREGTVLFDANPMEREIVVTVESFR